MENKKIIIVLIDSGININISDLHKYVSIEVSYKFSPNNIIESCDSEVKNEHGTAIALIIKNLCPNVEFISINILNERLVTDGRVLIYALKQALMYKPDIIHLSLGTKRYIYKLSLMKIVKKANKNNILIIAAASNDGNKCYPAFLKGVIGVKALDFDNYYCFLYKNGFFYALSKLININGTNELVNNQIYGTSISAGYITGLIASVKSKKYFYRNSEIVSYLIENLSK